MLPLNCEIESRLAFQKIELIGVTIPHGLWQWKCLSFLLELLIGKNMQNPNNQRRAVGLLVVFASVLTLLAIWDLPESKR
jgi:hypothetical protein